MEEVAGALADGFHRPALTEAVDAGSLDYVGAIRPPGSSKLGDSATRHRLLP